MRYVLFHADDAELDRQAATRIEREDFQLVRSDRESEHQTKGHLVIATVFKQRVGSDGLDARMAAGAFLLAACVFPALIVFWLLTMELTTWQWVVSMVATASLGFQLLVLSFLCHILRRKNDAG